MLPGTGQGEDAWCQASQNADISTCSAGVYNRNLLPGCEVALQLYLTRTFPAQTNEHRQEEITTGLDKYLLTLGLHVCQSSSAAFCQFCIPPDPDLQRKHPGSQDYSIPARSSTTAASPDLGHHSRLIRGLDNPGTL